MISVFVPTILPATTPRGHDRLPDRVVNRRTGLDQVERPPRGESKMIIQSMSEPSGNSVARVSNQ
jgi:hypothetical protein